jgi:prevent-host-death family protein
LVDVTKTITQRELRNDSAAVLREVQAGRTLIVTRNGTPIAELRPVPPRRFVPREVIAETARRAPRVDAEQFRRDLDRFAEPFAEPEPSTQGAARPRRRARAR